MQSAGARMILTIALCAGLASAAAVAVAAERGDVVRVSGDVRQDVYVAGQTVEVRGSVAGDVLAAGAQVSVGDHVTGDAMLAGRDVRVTGHVEDDVRAAGADVRVAAAAGGDAVLAGGSVRVAPAAEVAGQAWLAGGEVDVEGRIGRRLRVRASDARLAGHVAGDVDVVAERIVIEPTARVDGMLRYRSGQEPTVASGAVIAGGIQALPAEGWPGAARASVWIAGAVLAGLFLVGAAEVLLLPRFSSEAADLARWRPGRSLGVGLVVLVIVPIAIAALLMTVIGIPLGLVVLALYLVGLTIGLVMGALALMPWVGPAIVTLVLVLGLGALTLAFARLARGPVPAPG